MKYIVAATRWLVAAFVSLHLLSLRGVIACSQRKLNRAMQDTDAAVTAKHAAQNRFFAAKSHERHARREEKAVRAAHGFVVTTARAEADMLRREHNVGA